MIQKNTKFKPADNTGVALARVFHVYKGSKGKIAYMGDFIKCSILDVLPEKPVKKKSKHKAMVVRTLYRDLRSDRFSVSFKKNTCVILKKKLVTRGTFLRGPIIKTLKRRKFILSFGAKI